MTTREAARLIEHNLLRSELTTMSVREGCMLAREWAVGAVRVRPCDVALAALYLRGSGVELGTVVGFPDGASLTEVKVLEAQRAMEDGATQIDMVLNIGRLRSGELDYVREDIEAVVRTAHRRGVPINVILENRLINKEERVLACGLCVALGVDGVKTSTGLGGGGLVLAEIAQMVTAVDGKCRVLAAGGMVSLPTLATLRDAGCARVGTTSTRQIMEQAQDQDQSLAQAR
jgi:deoxyribose-phosphate aldolase